MYQRANRFVRFLRRNSFYLILGVTVIAFVAAGSALLRAGSTLRDIVAVNEDAPTDSLPMPSAMDTDAATPFEPTPAPTSTLTMPAIAAPEEEDDSAAEATPAPFAMIRPVDGEVIVAFTDDTLLYSETMDDYRAHRGIDVKAALSAPVMAAESGVVESVQQGGAMGTTIVIDHGNGYRTVYSNLSTDSMVQKGQKVAKGDVISGIGDTAATEALLPPHLHFEVQREGAGVDPLDLISY